jgi:kumamolisin
MDTQRMRSLSLSLVAVTLATAGATSAHAESVQAVIHLKEAVSMTDLAKSVTDPTSARYHEFYTNDELRQIAGPSDADYNSLINELLASGVQIVKESPTHLFITVRAEKSYLQSLQSRMVAQVESVNGLVKSQQRFPRYVISNKAAKAHTAADFTGFTPDQIHSLYGFDGIYKAGFSGKGQDIAIATYDGFYIQDVKDYYTKNNLSPGPSVDQVTFNGTPTLNTDSALETQLDSEFSGMIAQGANIHVFASATNDSPGELAMFTAILDDGRAKVVNYSWGLCEANLDPSHKTDMDAVFARAVAQGVNIMVASGDSGSDCNQDQTNNPDFPASNPNVVAVGGTSLTDNNGVASETAWAIDSNGNASGGGFSTLYPAPAYQNGVTNNAQRGYPDVAFNADPATGQPVWVHFDPSTGASGGNTATYLVIGGTSMAAPQWAGFMALVGEARASGKAIGFLNPLIYASKTAQTSDFNDITSGSNGEYTAAAGWDAVTGFGSMKASDLFTFLRSL